MDFETFLKVVLVTILIILIVMAFVKYQRNLDREISRVPKSKYREIKSKLKTGDVLITYAGNAFKGVIMNSFLGCSASHISMIVKLSSSNFKVIELGPYFYENQDVRIRDLDEVLMKTKFKKFSIVPSPKELKITETDLNQLFEAKKDLKFAYIPSNMFRISNTHRVCSNFIAEIHHEFGHRFHKPWSEITPCDFLKDFERFDFEL